MLATINDAIERTIMALLSVCFAGFIIVVLLQVLGRNVLRDLSILWAMEAALLLFAWTVFLGAAVAIRHRKHYLIEIIPPRMERANALLQLLASILAICTIAILIDRGFAFLPNAFTRTSLALGISQGYFYMAIPVAAVFMAIFQLEVMIEDALRVRAAFAKQPNAHSG